MICFVFIGELCQYHILKQFSKNWKTDTYADKAYAQNVNAVWCRYLIQMLTVLFKFFFCMFEVFHNKNLGGGINPAPIKWEVLKEARSTESRVFLLPQEIKQRTE